MTRRTTMGSPIDGAVDREMNSKYDIIKVVAEKINAIEDVSGAINDGTLTNMTNIINMLVASGPENTNATWDGTTLTIPKGDTGVQGIQGNTGVDGLTVNYDFTYNQVTGDLEYSEGIVLSLETSATNNEIALGTSIVISGNISVGTELVIYDNGFELHRIGYTTSSYSYTISSLSLGQHTFKVEATKTGLPDATKEIVINCTF